MFTYFIDESGHSGDLASSTGTNFDFDGQPYFALAAVGLPEQLRLEADIEKLRAKHKIPPGELKSKSLVSKPAFVAELIEHLIENQCPLFVEVVDKRFFICAEIVNCLLLPAALGYDGSAQMWSMRNVLADWLYDSITDEGLTKFVDACRSPSDHTLMTILGRMIIVTTAAEMKERGPDTARAAREMVESTILAYGKMRVDEPTAFLKFLPVPDDNKNAKKVWMLPNLSSLTNLYARINRFHHRQISGIKIVHDEQLQFDNILCHAKKATENVDADVFTPRSDYNFVQQAEFSFAASDRGIGIQCADVVAGAVMRFFRDSHSTTAHSPHLERIMLRLLSGDDQLPAFGINQFVPTRMVLQGV